MKIDYKEIRNIKNAQELELVRHKLKLTQTYSLKRLSDEQQNLLHAIEPAKLVENAIKKIPFVNLWVGNEGEPVKTEGFMRYVLFAIDLSSAVFKFYRR